MTSRTLILIRHAKSDWGSDARTDHDRPLNDRGRRDAARLGGWLAERGWGAPGAILCSDARRTRETAALAFPNREVELRPDLYLAEPGAILAALATARAETVALLAHNPGLGAAAALLARQAPDHDRFDDYPTAATTVLRFDTVGWTGLTGRGEVAAFVVPGELA